ncbi:MAG: calcium/sodium antiporter [Clostridia bacterium]|nr:calcium/sodium antiporter [Clostridia bacterium]
MAYVLLIIGFILLIKGADYFVDGSSGLAKIFKVPAVIIGLTIVSMGTSAPEAAVSITSGLVGKNALAISNIVGSNIFNLLIVIGVCAVIDKVEADKDIRKRDLPYNVILCALLLVMIAFDGILGTVDAIILLVLFVGYILWLVRDALKNRTQENDDAKKMPLWLCLICIVGGLAAIVFGGDMVVKNATKIATSLGMSENLVGLTIVAVGTSLPELVTSIVASRKGENEIALGNAVGSCIFNILFILGMSGALSPIVLQQNLGEHIVDLAVLIAVTLLFTVLCLIKKEVNRKAGFLCILLYIIYLAYIIARNYGVFA